MSMETIRERVKPAFGDEFDLMLSYPKKVEATTASTKKRSPITCFVSKNGSSEQLGAYVYSVLNTRTSEVHQTVLNSSEEQLLDLTQRASSMITKKYQVPSYVSFSGDFQAAESVMYLKEVIRILDKALSK